MSREQRLQVTRGLQEMPPSVLDRYLEKTTSTVIVSMGEALSITNCNRAFLRLVGLTEKPLGTSLQMFLEPESLHMLPPQGETGHRKVNLNFRTASGTLDRLACDVYGTDTGCILFCEQIALSESQIVARISALDDQLNNLTRNLQRSNLELSQTLALQKQAEAALQASHRFLEAANRHTQMEPLLQEFVLQVRELSGCEAVGMRILDEEGNIPYECCAGFPQAFRDSEGRLSIHRHECMCINVIQGRADVRLPLYTPGGSFYTNGTSRLLSEFSEADIGRTRNVCNDFGYESIALVPIRLGDRILGLIHVADRREDAVPLELVEGLERIAMQLGTAIQRVQSENALRTANDELELRVEERTAELARANENLQLEIQERERAEEELRKSETEMRLLSTQLLTAQEDERRRISRELHDTIGQSLSAVKFTVENTLQQLEQEGSDRGVRSLESAIQMVQEAVEETRRIQRNLRPPTLDDLGLLPTVSWFCREFLGVYSDIRIERQIDLEEEDVPAPLKIVIYRVMQEALNNVAKHSGADTVGLSLRRAGERIEMEMQDNGAGFDLKAVLSREGPERGFGLLSMRERTELSDGRFEIETARGAGTIIRASWPICVCADGIDR